MIRNPKLWERRIDRLVRWFIALAVTMVVGACLTVALTYYLVIEPLAVELSEDADIEFAAGLAVLACELEDISALEEELEDLDEFREFLAEKGRSCTNSFRGAARCWVQFRDFMDAPASWAEGLEQIDRYHETYAEFRNAMVRLDDGVRKLPARTAEAKSLKEAMKKATRILRNAGFLEWLAFEAEIEPQLVNAWSQLEESFNHWRDRLVNDYGTTGRAIFFELMPTKFSVAVLLTSPLRDRLPLDCL
jgi:hypothetical protein